MNISGIRPSIGFYDYNSISKIRQAEEAQASIQTQAEVDQIKPVVADDRDASVAAEQNGRNKQTFGAYDYANQYNPDETFEMVGKEADIHSLDVEKAISDMQKDQVLHEYQYFVGSDIAAGAQAGAATIRGAENFSL
ncbi:MAG: hypothetical protein II765_07640 [Lachnospiraceae bacterium]|jgi:hypothetical protein|nr:hypothetical protein [Lachnospiraceae bacterium]